MPLKKVLLHSNNNDSKYMRKAIIDIGTNTINLLIAEVKEQSYQIVHSSKKAAKLGRGGINNHTILPEAMQRGIDAINEHMMTIKDYNVTDVTAIGTSALRNAENANEFLERLKKEFGIDVKVISGDDEAQLIYDGVKQVMPIGIDRVLILDIGGGSTEFIIANKDGIMWKHSFELGMARLLDKFTPSDPVQPTEIKAIEAYIRGELTPLYEALQQYPTNQLIGTSGSFDTIAAVVAAKSHPNMNIKLATSYNIPISAFEDIHRKLMLSTSEQRMEMKQMDPSRVELVIPGSIFINFIIREMRITEMQQCSFALKQGALYQIINNKL